MNKPSYPALETAERCERICEMMDWLRDHRPHHWVDWMQQISSDEDEAIQWLKAKLLGEADLFSGEEVYLHWHNGALSAGDPRAPKFPYITNYEGWMRGRIEECLLVYEYEEDSDVGLTDEERTFLKGPWRARLVSQLLEQAMAKPRQIFPDFIEVVSPDEDGGWRVLTAAELDEFFSVEEDIDLDRIDSLFRAMRDRMVEQMPSQSLYWRLGNGAKYSQGVTGVLVQELGRAGATVSGSELLDALPFLNRSNLYFSFHSPPDGLDEQRVVLLEVHGGVPDGHGGVTSFVEQRWLISVDEAGLFEAAPFEDGDHQG